MTVPTSHKPAPEFRARLERELTRTLRRNASFKSSMRQSAMHRLKIAALFVAAVGLGAIAGVASGQVQDGRQRDQLLAAARAEVQLAEVRADLARSQAAAVQERHRLGLVGREVVASAAAEAERMRSALEKARLNVEEIQGSAAPPRDDIAAPLVRGRDFVTDRMVLRMSAVQHSLAAAESALPLAESRNRVGTASVMVVLEARADVFQHRSELEMLSERILLRRDYLQNRIDVGVVTRREQRLELTRAIRIAEEHGRLAQARLAHVTDRHRLGQADQIELLRAELAASEAALEIQRMQRQLAEFEAIRRE